VRRPALHPDHDFLDEVVVVVHQELGKREGVLQVAGSDERQGGDMAMRRSHHRGERASP
jgi:hypothetical protein